MQTELFPIRVEYSPQFKKDVQRLAKKYRHIRSDLQPLIDELQNRHLPGDRIQGTSYNVYKERLRNSDLNKGKSAGYRVIYFLEQHDLVYLLTIYSKSDQPSISQQQIVQIIKELETGS